MYTQSSVPGKAVKERLLKEESGKTQFVRVAYQLKEREIKERVRGASEKESI